MFLFPTFYEGFGLPILEAQSAGAPVVTSNVSSLPEIAGDGAIYANPFDSRDIANAAYKIISTAALRDDIIKKGLENIKQFSWESCAKGIAGLFKREI